jgi:hypothetical protein
VHVVPSTATTRNGPPLTQARSGPLSVLITRTRTGAPAAASTDVTPVLPLTVRRPL